MSLINTRIQNLRARGNLDKYEYRPSQYGALDLFLSQTDAPESIITQDMKEKALRSIGTTLEVPVIDYDSGISIGNTRSATIADSENTSQFVTITFATYAWGFTIVPALFKNNEIAMQEDFDKKFLKYLYQLGKDLDAAAETELSADKTQILNEDLGYAFNSNVVNALNSERDEIIGDLNPLMEANDFYDQLHLVGNPGVQSIIRKLAEHGIQNDQNKRLQYADKILHFSNRIANNTGKKATGYAVNGASVGMMTRLEREALRGTRSRTGHEWDVDSLPLLNLPVGTYYYESVGNYSDIAGTSSSDMTRVRKEHYGFSVDVAFITAYNSDRTTHPSPIIKFDVDTDETL